MLNTSLLVNLHANLLCKKYDKIIEELEKFVKETLLNENLEALSNTTEMIDNLRNITLLINNCIQALDTKKFSYITKNQSFSLTFPGIVYSYYNCALVREATNDIQQLKKILQLLAQLAFPEPCPFYFNQSNQIFLKEFLNDMPIAPEEDEKDNSSQLKKKWILKTDNEPKKISSSYGPGSSALFAEKPSTNMDVDSANNLSSSDEVSPLLTNSRSSKCCTIL